MASQTTVARTWLRAWVLVAVYALCLSACSGGFAASPGAVAPAANRGSGDDAGAASANAGALND